MTRKLFVTFGRDGTVELELTMHRGIEVRLSPSYMLFAASGQKPQLVYAQTGAFFRAEDAFEPYPGKPATTARELVARLSHAGQWSEVEQGVIQQFLND